MIYDTRPGGLGVSHSVFCQTRFQAICKTALSLFECSLGCSETSACVKCVQMANCPVYNKMLSKRGGKVIIEWLNESLKNIAVT
jgi:hypothetical protein